MIYFTQEAQEKLNKLFYYPYTFGKHLDKANRDLHSIEMSIPHLPMRIGTHSVTIRGIGSFTYLCNGKDIFIQFVTWSTLLTSFYYKKSNFIVFTSSGNIPSVHPALYIERTESHFRCDNGFTVVSRKYRGKDVFNFKDLDGHIICDIDFTQVKPFDEYKDMTARGYTLDRRCYMVFEDGYKEEVNESRNNKLNQLINECVNKCLKKYLKNEATKQPLNEYLDKNYGIPLYHTAKKELDGTRLIKPCWLIHYTTPKEASNIILNGFSNGVSKDGLNRQNLTYSNNAPHSNEGYSYAYKAKDFYERDSGDMCYILFWSSGVEYFNRMDNEFQIIFYNKGAKNRILIYEWNGEENIDGNAKYATFREKQLYGVGNLNNKPLYVGKLGNVIKWTITNFRQYQRNLTTNSKIPTVSDSTIKNTKNILILTIIQNYLKMH